MKVAMTAAVCALVAAAISGCTNYGGNSYDPTTAEVTGEAIAGMAAQSDTGNSGIVSMSTPSFFNLPLKSKLQVIADEAMESKALAAACPAVSSGNCAGGNSFSLTYSSCTGQLGVLTWNGSATFTFNSNAACSNVSGGYANLGANNSVTITSTGLTASYNGYSIETDSSASGYSVSRSGGTEVLCGSTDCGTQRTVTINGVHRKLTGPLGGTLFDHTLYTPVSFTITGTGSSKQITAGTLELQHNIARYTATSQINPSAPLTFSAGCCFPTGGQVTTTYTSGSKTGSETVTFGPSCGTATTSGGNSVTLKYCQ